MTDIAIRVENLGWAAIRWAAIRWAAIRWAAIRYAPRDKRYTLGTAKSATSVVAVSTVGSFNESMSSLFRRSSTPSHSASTPTPNPQNLTPTDFWALNDINFEIKRGEADDGVPRRHCWPPIRMMTDGL